MRRHFLIVVLVPALSCLDASAVGAEVLVKVERVVERAGEALRSPDPEERIRALEVLFRHAEHAGDALPDVVALLVDPDGEVRRSSALTLEAFGRSAAAAVPELLDALADSSPAVRGAAAFALGSVAGPEPDVVRALRHAARSSHPEERVGAAVALRRLGLASDDPSSSEELAGEARALLESGVHDEGTLVVSALARALVCLSPETAVEALPGLMSTALEDDVAASRARVALNLIGRHLETVPPGVVAGSKSSRVATRARSILTVQFLGLASPDALDLLVGALSDEREVATLAAETLAGLGASARGVAPELVGIVRTGHGEIRRTVALILVEISPEDADRIAREIETTEPDLALDIRKRILLSKL